MPDNVGEVSDGFHTFNELYDHRIALFLALAKQLKLGWKSHLHSDGSSYGGWFIVGLTLPNGYDITYHLPKEYWGKCDFLRFYQVAPEWDGHTSKDVVERLFQFVEENESAKETHQEF